MKKTFSKAALLTAALFALSSSSFALTSLGSLTLTTVKARIFTPNGDGFNDKVRFEFDNPEFLPINGTIFDVSGGFVADITSGTDLDVLLWDGKSSDGQVVPGGIYLYRIEYQGKAATGTIVVSR